MTSDIEQRLRAAYRAAAELDVPAPPPLGADPGDEVDGRGWPVLAAMTGLAAAALVALVVLAVRPSSDTAATDASRLAAEVWHAVPSSRPEGFAVRSFTSTTTESTVQLTGPGDAIVTIRSRRPAELADPTAAAREPAITSVTEGWRATWEERPGLVLEVIGTNVERSVVEQMSTNLVLVSDDGWERLVERDGYGSPSRIWEEVTLDRSMPGLHDDGDGDRDGHLSVSYGGSLREGIWLQLGSFGFTGVPEQGLIRGDGTGPMVVAVGPEVTTIELVDGDGEVVASLRPIVVPGNPLIRLASFERRRDDGDIDVVRFRDRSGVLVEEVVV